MIFKVIGGVVCGALGFFIGWKVRAKKANKEVQNVLDRMSDEVSKCKIELESYHDLFVTSSPENATEREKIWRQVAEDLKKGRKQVAEEKSNPPTEDKKDDYSSLKYNRPPEEFTDYRGILTKNSYAGDLEDEDHPIIRKTASNGIYEIEEWEYRESQEFELRDLYYYEMSSDVYDTEENMLDPAEIPLYLGYSQEDLAIRFLHDDEPQAIYVRNPDHQLIYCVYVCQGVGPE
jgi:hypothetical protein